MSPATNESQGFHSIARRSMTAGLAVLFVVAAGGVALAVGQYVHAPGDARAAERDAAASCAHCGIDRPITLRWEIAKDAKMAESIATF